MAEAYRINHPNVRMYEGDIAKLEVGKILDELNLNVGDVSVLVGGPPCQAYSTVGKRLIDDPRGALFQQYFRILKELEPEIFVFENVKGLLSMGGGELLSTIVELFESIGYHTQYRVLNAADYGTPQIRERVIIVGTRDASGFDFPAPTHQSPASANGGRSDLPLYLTLGEAIGDLPSIQNGESSDRYRSAPQNAFQEAMRADNAKILRDHLSPANNDRLRMIMELLPEGGGPSDLPPDIRPTSGFANTYCRLWWDRPSTTITRNLGTPSSSRCIHPKDARALTTREGARLQGFPDSYVFFGSRADKNLQIGNAVPTPLSSAIADSVRAYLDRKKRP